MPQPKNQVYALGSDKPLFDGPYEDCLDYVRTNGLRRKYNRGSIRVGRLFWEVLDSKPSTVGVA